MGLRINTNIQSLAAQRFLNVNSENQKNSMDHLSSGSRINRSGDDAAGLAISEKLKASVRSLGQAGRNAADGISLVQVAEGGMNEVSNILIRLRELSIQGASDTIGDIERGFLDKEVQQLKAEVNRIAASTEFNGHKLLDGTTGALEIQIGMNNDAVLDRMVFDSANLVTSNEALGIGEVSITNKEQSQTNLEKIDFAINRLNDNRSTVGALQNRLMSTISNINIYRENLSAANSRIRDTDMAAETSELTKHNILTQATVSTLAQANQVPQLALKLLG